MHKLRQKKGETLIETLIAIIVITFSSIMFLNITMSVSKINLKVQAEDDKFREELMTAEMSESGIPGNITVKSSSSTFQYNVEYYGKESGLFSYTSVN